MRQKKWSKVKHKNRQVSDLETECIKGRAECETKATENTAKEINNLRDEIIQNLLRQMKNRKWQKTLQKMRNKESLKFKL